jgi:hypothetical protein
MPDYTGWPVVDATLQSGVVLLEGAGSHGAALVPWAFA